MSFEVYLKHLTVFVAMAGIWDHHINHIGKYSGPTAGLAADLNHKGTKPEDLSQPIIPQYKALTQHGPILQVPFKKKKSHREPIGQKVRQ